MKIHLTGHDLLSPPCRISVSRKVIFNPFSELARSSSHHPSDGPPHPLAGGTTGEGAEQRLSIEKKNPPSQKLSGFFSICIKLQWVNRKSSN